MKKLLSLLLALCMCFPMTAQIGAWSTDGIAVPETEASDAADAEYVQGVVLFALESADVLPAIADALEKVGVTGTEPLFTEDGAAAGFGERDEVWYRAEITGDARTAAEAIAALDGVCGAEPEYLYTSENYGEPTEIEKSKDWAYKKLHKHENKYWWKDHFNHTEAPGYGTVVAVIDTGVDYTHEDLVSSMWVNVAEMYGTAGVDDDKNGYIDDIYGVDTTASGTKAGNPMDDNGHGTHVAGIVAMAANGEGGVGLAYGAKIMAVKAGQSTGTFSSANIAKAINYAHMMGADVINMSFGGTGKSYLVETALESAFADCVLVASAGNNGRPTTDADPALHPKREDIYPAAYSYVIGVMATDENGKLAGFSNWDYIPNANAEYELTAPGVGIHSTLPGNRYAEWNGTSMAAPFVSAAAAILRSHYNDKTMYSSRFIMGQLASATQDRMAFTAPAGDKSYSYPALNVYDSMTYLPKPNITVKDTFLMDNVRSDNALNDGDAIIDAGETVDLGVLVRNQWGLTGAITVKADAISIGGVANPYITFIKDEVILQPAGTFAEVNNGFVYDDSYLTAISDPIQFIVAANTPNDTEICINLTVTTTNGADVTDTVVYTPKDPVSHTFRVQAGRSLRGTISEDMTLTNDYLWIVENSVLIPEGVTLTVEPGTKMQFWSSDYENAYNTKAIVEINCEGTFNAIGTENAPIEMYPGSGFENYAVVIYGTGTETLRYCNIINPVFQNPCYSTYANYSVDCVDHCVLTQNYVQLWCRTVEYTGAIEDCDNFVYAYISSITDTQMYNLDFGWGIHTSVLRTSNIQNCLMDTCRFEIEAQGDTFVSRNNVFMGTTGTRDSANFGDWREYSSPIKISELNFYDSVYSESTYMIVRLSFSVSNSQLKYDALAAAARSLGGTLASITDAEEAEFIINDFAPEFSHPFFVGCRYNRTTCKYEWDDGNSYELEVLGKAGSPYVQIQSDYIDEQKVYNYYGVETLNTYMLLEFPAELTLDEIRSGLRSFDYLTYANTYLEEHPEVVGDNSNNAFINPVLNNAPTTWAKMRANTYNSGYEDHYAPNNYYGTENPILIDLMIMDADDYPTLYQDIIHDPILTLSSPSLAEIYPFVTSVYMTDSDGNIVQNTQPGQTYSVHVLFNRDMDMTVQPSVTYGAATPYTDYAVHGDFISPREWVGTTTISPILNSGTMYFRTVGGCAADDNWLVCGEDVLRFSFNISTVGTLAMLLNAEGGANKVELSWAQNDYDVLAGYNIYRSTSETTGFEKLNVSVLTGTEYTDTDVEPGVLYYYYFKVVNTEGNEEDGVSNTASAAPIDNIFPVLKHTAIPTAKMNSAVTVSATATDNIAVSAVTLYYRTVGETAYQTKVLTASATENLYVGVIPAAAVTAAGIEYYVTAADADGNVSYSGTSIVPHVITVNSSAYISGITPSKVSIEGGKTITILGGNFTEGMTLKVGTVEIEEFSVADSGTVSFIAPAMSGGSYAVTLTTADGKTAISPTSLSYTDASSIVQIPTSMTMTSGISYVIPFYATSAGEIISLHAELDLPAADFTSVKVEKVDPEAAFQLEYTYKNGILKIGCIGTADFNPADEALLNIIVTPKVTEDKQYALTLHDVSFNGAPVSQVISGEVLLKPSYTINATVEYFEGDNNVIEGVMITADGIQAVTDAAGSASLVVSNQKVSVTASYNGKANAVTAYDASLVLQSAVDMIELSEHQLLAADVDGNGVINEYDAALILQMAVRKLEAFPVSMTWVFVPSYKEVTLNAASANNVSFIAISVGDVDGSYQGGAE